MKWIEVSKEPPTETSGQILFVPAGWDRAAVGHINDDMFVEKWTWREFRFDQVPVWMPCPKTPEHIAINTQQAPETEPEKEFLLITVKMDGKTFCSIDTFKVKDIESKIIATNMCLLAIKRRIHHEIKGAKQ